MTAKTLRVISDLLLKNNVCLLGKKGGGCPRPPFCLTVYCFLANSSR